MTLGEFRESTKGLKDDLLMVVRNDRGYGIYWTPISSYIEANYIPQSPWSGYPTESKEIEHPYTEVPAIILDTLL